MNKISQTLKEFDSYFDYFSQIAPAEEGYKDGGHSWIEFSDKWNAFKKELVGNTKIISGFPGVGKSTCVSMFNDPYNGFFVLDSDSSKFPKDNFPQNYLEHIYYAYHVSKPTILLVSSHEEVRWGMVSLGLPFDLVFPEKKLLGEYIQRFENRGSSKTFIDVIYKNWDAWIDSCQAQKECKRVELSTNYFLSNYVSDNMKAAQ